MEMVVFTFCMLFLVFPLASTKKDLTLKTDDFPFPLNPLVFIEVRDADFMDLAILSIYGFCSAWVCVCVLSVSYIVESWIEMDADRYI